MVRLCALIFTLAGGARWIFLLAENQDLLTCTLPPGMCPALSEGQPALTLTPNLLRRVDDALAEHIHCVVARCHPPIPAVHLGNDEAAEPFRPGDLVRLRAGLARSSLVVTPHPASGGTAPRALSLNAAAAAACLGAADAGRLGVVVEHRPATGAGPSRQAAVRVASATSGHLCDYAPDDLVYADGSRPGPNPPQPHCEPATATPPPPARAWRARVGDRVRLRASARRPTNSGSQRELGTVE